MATSTSNSPIGGINFGTPPGAGGSQNQPLGVPTGYKAPISQLAGSTRFDPNSPISPATFGAAGATTSPLTDYGTTPNSTQYISGDQWKVPLSDPESVPLLQQQLVQAGLLNPKEVRYGTWDIASANAYSHVLGFANAYGLNANQALQVLISNPSAQSAGSGGSTGPTIAFTNPQDVQTGFQNVSQNLTGQEQPTGDFVNAYHGLEAAQAHGTGRNYTQAPSVQGAATQYLINKDPSEVQAYGAASRMQELYSMLGVNG